MSLTCKMRCISFLKILVLLETLPTPDVKMFELVPFSKSDVDFLGVEYSGLALR